MNIDFNAGKKINKISDDDEKEEIIEESSDEIVVEDTPSNKNNYDKSELKKKLVKVCGIIIIIFIIFLLIILVATLFTKKNYTYSDVEQIMKEAAISYFNDNPHQLPKEDNTVTISVDNLIMAEKMKDLDEYLGNDVSCKGTVDVENIDNKYVYSPYLNCGDSYQTIELYKKITAEENIVTNGFGLYSSNGDYVYKGDNVNNYVKLDNFLWRIVKVRSDNTMELILADPSIIFFSWDDRYNKNTEYESGINNYATSRAKELLNGIYDGTYDGGEEYDTDEYLFISNKDKEKMVPINACVGKRSDGDGPKNNSIECSEKLNNQYITLLTASDYMNASLDTNCINTTNKTCGNYNYLKHENKWWLLTANKSDTAKVYIVEEDGSLVTTNAGNVARIRPVINLKSNTFYRSGNGTLKKPYKVK